MGTRTGSIQKEGNRLIVHIEYRQPERSRPKKRRPGSGPPSSAMRLAYFFIFCFRAFHWSAPSVIASWTDVSPTMALARSGLNLAAQTAVHSVQVPTLAFWIWFLSVG